MAWDDGIKSFDLETVPNFYEGAAADARSAKAGLDADLKIARVSERRQLLHMLDVANAAKHLERIPDQAETFHCIMRGNYYNGWDLVPALLKLAAPRTIATLHVATLGFNQQNAFELLRLFDEGQIGRVEFICSVYFRDMTSDVWSYLHAELSRRKQHAVAIRSHAKILLLELSDGTALVVESSANLRSCHNIEQFTLTHDRDVLEFHRQWMDQLIREAINAKGKEAETEKPKGPPRKPRKTAVAAGGARNKRGAAGVPGTPGGNRQGRVGARATAAKPAKARAARSKGDVGRVRRRLAALG